jgi:hypothetical protein
MENLTSSASFDKASGRCAQTSQSHRLQSQILADTTREGNSGGLHDRVALRTRVPIVTALAPEFVTCDPGIRTNFVRMAVATTPR